MVLVIKHQPTDSPAMVKLWLLLAFANISGWQPLPIRYFARLAQALYKEQCGVMASHYGVALVHYYILLGPEA